MDNTRDDACTGTLFSMHRELTIYQAADWRELLHSACQSKSPLTLNLSDITEVDTAGIQLLMMARRQLGKDLHLSSPSPALHEALELLNLQALID